jgi:diguanylate cyclase (GGDEF)-like protein
VLQYGSYDQGLLIDIPWLLGFVLFGATGLHPSMAELTQPVVQPNTRLSRRRLALLTGASLIAPVLLLSQTLLARRDGLTGIPNRRTWDNELPVAMDRARRDGVPLAVAILDLDHFKDFNDEPGHQAGDRLLKSATSAWSRTLRTTDLLCGYGGEEFGVLPPAATTDQAAEVLERLRAVTPQGQTFSAGLAGWDGQEVSDELVARADRALCAAKAAGRDRIVVGNHQPTARDHQAAAAHPR